MEKISKNWKYMGINNKSSELPATFKGVSEKKTLGPDTLKKLI